MVHDFKKFPELTNKQLEVIEFESPHKQITDDFEAVVSRVHDGDTITLGTSFRDFDFPLRFLDIDAPELNEGGADTRDWLKSRLLGEDVTILINPKNRVDKYGRLLGKVFNLGMDVGEEMLRLGMVTTFKQRNEGKIDSQFKMFSLKKWFGPNSGGF